MSSRIWTAAALSSEAVRLDGKVWRLVEAQHRVSTLPERAGKGWMLYKKD